MLEMGNLNNNQINESVKDIVNGNNGKSVEVINDENDNLNQESFMPYMNQSIFEGDSKVQNESEESSEAKLVYSNNKPKKDNI